MKYSIDLSHIKTCDLFDKVLSVDRKTNLFYDLRNLYVKEVQNAILQSGIKTAIQTDNISAKLNANAVQISPIPSLYNNHEKLDVDFCAGYGVGERTLSAISYQHGIYHDLPSLDTFVKRENFSIGNFGFLVDNGDYEIEIISNDDVKIVGYSSQINAKKKKSFIAILGVHFDYNSILKIAKKYNDILEKPQLIDVQISSVNYPQIFMCRITGMFYVCNCFKDYIDWKWDFERFTHLEYYPDVLDRVKKITYLKSICHYCNKTTPVTEVQNQHSSFLNKYVPYYYLECKKRFGSIFHFEKEDRVNLENELREYFGYPKIGERWTTETLLYNLIKEILPNQNIIFHYRGKEMQGLELDIFVPELKLGIEYQGEQHFDAIEHWGGEEGLEQRQKNDERKKHLCEKNGYTLVEFSCIEEITRNLVVRKLEEHLIVDESIKATIENEEKKQTKQYQPKTTEINYDLWIEQINTYLNNRYSDIENSDDDIAKITTDCVNAFAGIAEQCFKYGKFKDKWEYGHFYLYIYGPELIIKSSKTRCDYKIGLDREGIYLSTDLRHNENLRYMGDDFWKLLLNISEYEDFKYEEYEFVSDKRRKEFPELFGTNKSIIYRILRKYIFDKTETDYQYISGSVGELKILCSFKKDFDAMIGEFCKAFKMMYQLNYMLWKVSDLKSKQK